MGLTREEADKPVKAVAGQGMQSGDVPPAHGQRELQQGFPPRGLSLLFSKGGTDWGS